VQASLCCVWRLTCFACPQFLEGREGAGIVGMNVARPSEPLQSEDLGTLTDEQLIRRVAPSVGSILSKVNGRTMAKNQDFARIPVQRGVPRKCCSRPSSGPI